MTHEERVHHHMYETCEGIAEHAERIVSLEELVQDLYGEYRYLRVRFHRTYVQHEERMRAIEQRMRKLGMEL